MLFLNINSDMLWLIIDEIDVLKMGIRKYFRNKIYGHVLLSEYF